MSYWDSLDFLSKLHNTLTISFIILSAIFGIIMFILQNRISELKDGQISLAQQTIIELEKKQKPRILTKEQRTAFINCLSNSKQNGLLYITRILGEHEALMFAQTIKDIILLSGWDVHDFNINPRISIEDSVGLTILFSSENKTSQDFVTIKNAFNKINISLKEKESEKVPSNAIRLIVGKKP